MCRCESECYKASTRADPADFGWQEDRKRLKEKLKVALESESQGGLQGLQRFAFADPDRAKEEWLEYFFGICKPDRRNGKQGSRYQSIWCCVVRGGSMRQP
jgi:hypothetical protein